MTILASPHQYSVSWVDAGGASSETALGEADLVIGRSSTCGLPLNDGKVSRVHARIRANGDVITIEDLGSRNGTYVNGEKITTASVKAGDEIRIGDSVLDVMAPMASAPAGAATSEGTVIAGAPALSDATQIIASADGAVMVTRVLTKDPESTQVLAPVEREQPVQPRVRGLVSDDLLNSPIISEQDLIDNGVEVKVAEFAALGGGMGSFIFTDYIRCAGVPENEINVVGNEDKPYARYARLCKNSQIPLHERLRSNSDSCPDNQWGFPSYAVREAVSDILHGRIISGGYTFWKLWGEPAIAETYTPRSGDVFRGMDKEAGRIGWSNMLIKGRIRRIRKTKEGRILAVISQSEGTQRKHIAVSAKFVHLAIGYPAIQLLPDLAEYREKYEDTKKVVNAYEQHDHVYEQLKTHGGTVLLRGRGIVASRIIQKLWELRKDNKNINIVHLHRTRITSGHKYGLSKRAVAGDAEFQPFNWPKGCWTGELRSTLERADDQKRAELLAIWGGTTTANRRDWGRILRSGLKEGWYRPEYGKILGVTQEGGRVVTKVQGSLVSAGTLDLAVDFVIDCTGLVASPERSPLLDDMIKTYGLRRNALNRIWVTNDFEIDGMRHEGAKMYTCGAVTLGGPFATVDSFLGLEYASLRAMRHMRISKARTLKRLAGLTSILSWFKWARGAKA